jgi:hypothetical protein
VAGARVGCSLHRRGPRHRAGGQARGHRAAGHLGSATIVSGSQLDHNQTRGGRGNQASGAGAFVAGVGAGGGIFDYLGDFNSSGNGQLNASVVTVTNSTLDQNQAQGGGGNGLGGGIANLLSAATTLDSSYLTNNLAIGTSGAGLGGGAYNDVTSTLNLTNKSSVTGNHAS